MSSENPYRSPQQGQVRPVPLVDVSLYPGSGPIVVASILLTLDVIVSGSYMWSCLICPLWFLASIGDCLIRRRWLGVDLVKTAIPAIALGIVLGNYALQQHIAAFNADRIIDACEQFRSATEKYPSTLDELVPDYLHTIPRAKYCLWMSNFEYFGDSDSHRRLKWYLVPPYARMIYSFETKSRYVVD